MKSFIRRRLQMAGPTDRGEVGLGHLFGCFVGMVGILVVVDVTGMGPGAAAWREEVEQVAKVEGVSVVDVASRLFQPHSATVRTDDGLLVDVEERDGDVVVPVAGGAQLLGPWLDAQDAAAAAKE